jgi:hypothetical protein
VRKEKSKKPLLGPSSVAVFVRLQETPHGETALIFWKNKQMKDKNRLKKSHGKPAGKYYWAIHDVSLLAQCLSMLSSIPRTRTKHSHPIPSHAAEARRRGHEKGDGNRNEG